MAKWTEFAATNTFEFDNAKVKKHWARLHIGDAEVCPKEPAVLAAWALFHQGHFQQAFQAGLDAGSAGITVANKSVCIYANYLEKKEKTRLDLFKDAAARAEAQATRDPNNASAWYWQAYALGRYSQGISVAKALAQGLGGKIKDALERVIKLQPNHADAHVALGSFHAEVIDKVGSLIGSMTYGAKKDAGIKQFEAALKLNPNSSITLIEYAKGLVMLEGEAGIAQANKLYVQAAAIKPLDATEWLDAALAQTELEH